MDLQSSWSHCLCDLLNGLYKNTNQMETVKKMIKLNFAESSCESAWELLNPYLKTINERGTGKFKLILSDKILYAKDLAVEQRKKNPERVLQSKEFPEFIQQIHDSATSKDSAPFTFLFLCCDTKLKLQWVNKLIERQNEFSDDKMEKFKTMDTIHARIIMLTFVKKCKNLMLAQLFECNGFTFTTDAALRPLAKKIGLKNPKPLLSELNRRYTQFMNKNMNQLATAVSENDECSFGTCELSCILFTCINAVMIDQNFDLIASLLGNIPPDAMMKGKVIQYSFTNYRLAYFHALHRKFATKCELVINDALTPVRFEPVKLTVNVPKQNRIPRTGLRSSDLTNDAMRREARRRLRSRPSRRAQPSRRPLPSTAISINRIKKITKKRGKKNIKNVLRDTNKPHSQKQELQHAKILRQKFRRNLVNQQSGNHTNQNITNTTNKSRKRAKRDFNDDKHELNIHDNKRLKLNGEQKQKQNRLRHAKEINNKAVCICGAKLILIQAKYCYDVYQSIVCDKCGKMISGNKKVYHCDKGKITEHKDGYDLCNLCAKAKIKKTNI